MNKTVEWKQDANGDLQAEHRGLAIWIKVDRTGRPRRSSGSWQGV